jgi:acid phosphatase
VSQACRHRAPRWGLAIAFLFLFAGTPVFADTPAGCGASMPQAVGATAQASNLALFKRQLIRYRCTRYDADVTRVDHDAGVWMARRASHVAQPALVLDIDETALSNWPVMVHNDFAYFRDGDCDLSTLRACGQAAWEKSEAATAIAPTLSLFNAAKAQGVAVFFVTGRRESAEASAVTEGNLRKAGYDGWTGIYLRPANSHEASVAVYKSNARATIEAQGYHIIANVGDQQSDLTLGHAERSFKLPNPFYYLP